MSQGAALERELQSLAHGFEQHVACGVHTNAAAFNVDMAKARDAAMLCQQWIAGLAEMTDMAEAANLPLASKQFLAKVFGDVNERIDKLNDKLLISPWPAGRPRSTGRTSQRSECGGRRSQAR